MPCAFVSSATQWGVRVVLAVCIAGAGQLGASDALGQLPLTGASTSDSAPRPVFSLVDHHGRAVNDETYRGRFVLVYFGYSHCPDVCPVGLRTMSVAMNLLGESGELIQPIFITVDPERDTLDVLAAYVGFFHPRLIGLTGTREQIARIAKDYGARYFKVFPPPFQDDSQDDEESEDGEEEDENASYLMHHSASTYLVGPNGGRLATFVHGTSPSEMASGIQRFTHGTAHQVSR